MLRPVVLIASLALVPALTQAQSGAVKVTLKPGSINAPTRSACATVVKPSGSPTDAQRQQARALVQRGQQAAIIGDDQAALKALQDASGIDPTDPNLAYQLARAYEATRDGESAAREYCRFLLLSPTAPEAGEVMEKVRALSPPKLDPAMDSALTAFQSGVEAYERRQYYVAEGAFTTAIAFDPAWADAYYNRGQVRLASDDRERARADFELYLQLKPTANDHAQVAKQVAALRRPIFVPGVAFLLGAVFPGGGQFYTHQPILGVLALGGVGGAIAYAIQEKSTTIVTQTATADPFGNPYTFTTERLKTDRPNAVVGAAVAGGIAGVSAIAAAIYANASNTESRRVYVSVVPNRNGLLVGMTLVTR